jgi:predicted DNA-binding ribbon-helix-helix protein
LQQWRSGDKRPKVKKHKLDFRTKVQDNYWYRISLELEHTLWRAMANMAAAEQLTFAAIFAITYSW